jgi:hypothetical protein
MSEKVHRFKLGELPIAVCVIEDPPGYYTFGTSMCPAGDFDPIIAERLAERRARRKMENRSQEMGSS